MIHQFQRETDDRGRVIATEADYLAVRELVSDLISDQAGKTVTKTTRQTVVTVAAKDTDNDGQGVTVTALASKLDLEHTTAYRRVRAAHGRGYLINIESESGRGRKAARYRPGAQLPDDVVMLPDLPSADIWSACTFTDPDDYLPDDEAAGQQTADAKSANVRAAGACPRHTRFGPHPKCPDCQAPAQ